MGEAETRTRSDDAGLSGKELYELKKGNREYKKNRKLRNENRERMKSKINSAPKKAGQYIILSLIVVGAIVGVRALTRIGSNLPTTTAQGHVEEVPESHILDTPLTDAVQSHMIEHSDGAGPPGVIIQYNCEDFECAGDLVERLTKLAGEYPVNTYLAPNRYDGKIILTKAGDIEVLDGFDEEAIRTFIGIGRIQVDDSGAQYIEVPVSELESVLEASTTPIE